MRSDPGAAATSRTGSKPVSEDLDDLGGEFPHPIKPPANPHIP